MPYTAQKGFSQSHKLREYDIFMFIFIDELSNKASSYTTLYSQLNIACAQIKRTERMEEKIEKEEGKNERKKEKNCTQVRLLVPSINAVDLLPYQIWLPWATAISDGYYSAYSSTEATVQMFL